MDLSKWTDDLYTYFETRTYSLLKQLDELDRVYIFENYLFQDISGYSNPNTDDLIINELRHTCNTPRQWERHIAQWERNFVPVYNFK